MLRRLTLGYLEPQGSGTAGVQRQASCKTAAIGCTKLLLAYRHGSIGLSRLLTWEPKSLLRHEGTMYLV